ncbi:hypothetical protein J6590_020060 [Homalodisca vitripennis]|nr:hypothetical protein J6590_020060 [Homalodisca vitripennis]
MRWKLLLEIDEWIKVPSSCVIQWQTTSRWKVGFPEGMDVQGYSTDEAEPGMGMGMWMGTAMSLSSENGLSRSCLVTVSVYECPLTYSSSCVSEYTM